MSRCCATVRRFGAAADGAAKRKFARALIAGLEEVGVPPGREFVVTTGAHLEELEAELNRRSAELEELEADWKDAVAAVARIKQVVDDYRLGLLDREEMLKAVKDYGVQCA